MVRREAASGRSLISGLAGRREQVQVLGRDRADRLERSRSLARGRDLAVGATAVRDEVESGAVSGRNGNRADKNLVASRADQNLVASRTKGRRADLMERREGRFALKVIGHFQSHARDRQSGLTAGETRHGAREARRDGCSGPVAREVTKVADRRDAETGLLLDLKRSAGK